MTLPAAFLDRPIAHRALHGPGRPENSLAAIEAAVAAGYGIEIDLQLSADDQAIVFHDYDLGRLTLETGAVRQRAAADLTSVPLSGGTGTIPDLPTVLRAVGGRVPLLIEVKDQDGAMGPAVGPLEEATAAALRGYDGPVALMSFNPHSVAALAEACPGLPRGLTTCAYEAETWPLLSQETRESLARIEAAETVGVSFISHQHRELGAKRVGELKEQGLAILCWTIRAPSEEAQARSVADNITFEGYLP